MARAKQQDEWSRTANIMALHANIHRDPKRSSTFHPRQFMPFESSGPKKRDRPGVPISILKDVFVKEPGRG